MKKITNYLLFILFCLIGFASVTKAYELNYNEEMPLMSYDEEHKNPKCEVTSGNISSSPYTMVPASGEVEPGGSVILKYNKEITTAGELIIDCKYISIREAHNEEKKQTYWFKYGIESEGVAGDFFVIFDNFDYDSYDITSEMTYDSIVSLTLDDCPCPTLIYGI